MELARKGKAKRRHLNSEECDELGRSPEGTSALGPSQSLPDRQKRSDPNRGLHPRASPKKLKLGSPSKQQRPINDFYQVTKVVRSSPQKSSLPCSSRHNGEITLQAELRGKCDLDDDEDDDISLLAAVAVEHADVEAQEEGDIDHLEGIVPEMFDDCLFDDCDSATASSRDPSLRGTQEQPVEEEEVEEEVEALLDKHYGLLGRSKGLVVPQGCMEDLPEEVLREILVLLPAQDLYRSVSLVCQSWRTIVQDPKFAPYKKQYYSYMMRRSDAVVELKSTMEMSGILDPRVPEESVRRLVSLMAQHKSGERLRPEDIMRCLESHRLFPVAQSCLTLRFPDIQQHGPNPYAAMALILVLSESVGDVQALVSRLAGCMSRCAISEYLSQMAMFLLAMMRNEVKISNRLHYNIFYVLHLMQSPSVSAGHGGEQRFQVTNEQQQILSHDIQPDHVVKIMAFAGTGKTSTLVRFAEARPHLRFLYVAFNKSVAVQAERTFPTNVACKTVHSLAYNDVGKSYSERKKLAFNLKPFSIAWVLPAGRGGYVNAKVVTTTLNAYMASTDQSIGVSHVPHSFKNNRGKKQILDHDGKMAYVRDSLDIWRKMKDLNAPKKGGCFMTHDGYLKLWQLKEPKPCLSYDVIFIDEAQDCTPAIMDVLMSQRCAKVLVGDPHQQIYTFRGAINALYTTRHTHLYYLTQSFRFGPEIAYVGATLLQVCKKVQKILVGGDQKDSVYGESFDAVTMAMHNITSGRGKTAILCRCNFGVFKEAVELTGKNPDCRIYFVGGVVGVGLNKIMDIWHLKESGSPESIQDPFIRSFGGYDNLNSYAQQTEDIELMGKISVVSNYSHRTPELVRRLRACHQDDYRRADFIIGTVHKAKGLEFDTVMLCDDFVKIPCARHHLTQLSGFSWGDIPEDEWNLLYVAVTRAKCTLILTKNIANILTQAGEYLLKVEMTSSLLTDGLPPRCTVRQCLNHVCPGSAFTMCKRPIKYTDGETRGGPLCEKCAWRRVGPTAFLMSDEALTAPAAPEQQDLPINVLLGVF